MREIALFDQISKRFGFNLTIQNHLQAPINAIHIPERLFDNILADAERTFGGTILKMSASPEDYMRYKNGQISSIIKGESGFGAHIGFEPVQLVSIVDYVFSATQEYYTDKILSEFYQTTSEIFRSIDEAKQQIYQQAFDFKDMSIAEELSSFSHLFSEIGEEINSISSSQIRAQGYVTELISIKTDSYRIYEYCIGKLNSWLPEINRSNNVNYNNLLADYLLCRQTIACYMSCLVYEHVISGCIDESAKESIKRKVGRFLKRFTAIDEQIRHALRQRDASNYYSSWSGYYHRSYYHQNDSNGINWFLSNFGEDSEFEIKKIDEIFDKSKKILRNIELIIDKPEDQDFW